MRNTLILMILSMLLLAACSSPPAVQTQAPQVVEAQPTTTNQPVAPTEAPATEPPSATEPPLATEPTTTEAPAASGAVVYKIIPGESQLQYEVGEVFINDNNRFNTAIGVTPQVTGEITVDLSAPQNSSLGTITADISQFKSDSGRRDNAIRTRFLESERYPTVTFVPTQVEGLPATYTEGQEMPLKISGDLTIRDVTKPVTFDAVVKLQGDSLTGQATTTILMSDFGFGPISIGGILNTEDEAKVTLVLVARP